MIATMTTAEALLATIIAEPTDDLVRLAFADHLEEMGQDVRAEFIRAQVEAAATGQVECEQKVVESPSSRPIACGRCRFCRHDIRAWNLYSEALPEFVLGERFEFSFAHTTSHVSLSNDWLVGHITLYLWRGFIHTVRSPMSAWLEHGPAIVRSHPVERVEATDKRPEYFPANEMRRYARPRIVPGPTGFWRWFDGSRVGEDYPADADSDEIPRSVWDIYASLSEVAAVSWEHPSEAHARDALSAALILHARR